MSKNVAVFVDVANIFFAAKAAGVDIDYVTLLKSATAGRDLVRAYAYTGLDPENENQRNFHDFLRRHGYKVVSKDIRKYGDGKVKANLDIELVVDMMKTARNLDIAIVVSGDGDFAPAIRAVQEMGVRCEVISFRGNTSSDLIEVADLFTDITQLARVEKGTRSGRRVADDDADLSMTEVPDKQTEGSGLGRGGRGRGGRGRGRSGEAEPVPTTTSRTRGGRGRAGAVATNGVGGGRDGDGGLVALPGERLSKVVGNLTESDLAAAEVFTLDDLGEPAIGPVEGSSAAEGAARDADGEESREDDAGRRRRRRGGRGRGRGRGRDETAETPAGLDRLAAAGPARSPERVLDEDADDVDDEQVAPRAPRTTPFGSVWDSQLGTTAAPSSANLTPLSDDDEDFDEPEIPEYLIAEQRRGARGGRGGPGGQGGRGGPRGGRSAYQSAVERERYGRGGGGGINRYPDVSGRTGGNAAPPRGPREDRGPRRDDRAREAAPRATSSTEPWSEVPPELEALLRAQVSQKPSPAEATRPNETQPVGADAVAAFEAVESEAGAAGAEAASAEAAPATKRRTTRKPAAAKAASPKDDESAAPKRRSTRKAASATGDAADTASASAEATMAADTAEAPAPKRRTTRKPAAGADAAPADEGSAESATDAKPKRRATRKTATSSSDPA